MMDLRGVLKIPFIQEVIFRPPLIKNCNFEVSSYPFTNKEGKHEI